MDEELRNLIEGAKKQGASDNDIKRIIDLYIADSKKKGVSEPTVQKKQLDSRAQQKNTPISSDTEETQPLVESDGLGGPPKSFPKRDSNIKSVMYGDGTEQQNVLVQSLPLGEKPKKYYRLVSEQRKEVDKKIAELEDRNTRLGRRPEDLAREGTYQSLIQNKQQLDSEFKPAELAISEIKKGTPTWTRPIERIISSATDGKYSLANTETIKLNKEVEDRLIDSFDDAPEETRQKWYKGSLPLEQKEKIINNAKVDVLNNTFKSLKSETSNYLKNIKDNPSISDDEKSLIRNEIKAKSDAFNAQVALDFSGNLLKNNFKATDEDKNLDEAIFSKYEGFIPETADMVSRFVEGVISTGGKALTGIPTLALLGAEQFNQFTGASKPEDYTPIEATVDLINDTTNYNFLPSSKSEEGAIVDKEGNLNLSYRSITRTLADTLPFTLKIMSDVKKGRVEGSPQSMVSQLLNPSKNKAFTDRLNIVETAYKVTVNDNYKDAKEIGMDDSKAFTYANVLSLAEGVSETIMPDFKYFDSLTGSTLKNVFKSNLKEAATKQAVKNVTKDFFKNAALELGEEEFVLAVEDGLKYSLLLNHKNSEFFNIKRQKELVAATVIMSGAMGSVAIPGKFKQNKTDIYREVYNNISDIQDTFINEINSPLNDDKSKESLITAYKFANDISNAIANAPETVTADQVDLLVQKKKLEEKKKNIDTAFHPDINEEIAGIDAKIRELSKQPVAAEEVVAPTEVVAEEATPVEYNEVKNSKVIDLESQRDAEIESLKSKRLYDEKNITPIREKYNALIIKEKTKETESKIKNKNLFLAEVDENGNRVIDKKTGKKSNSVGEQISQSKVAPVPTSVREVNGIEFVEFSNPKTGDVDVVVTGKNDGSYVGYYRLYENGNPTNKWSSKFENPSRNKEDFKTMISGVQKMLPEGHEYTEKASISTDGLRVWNQQLGKGYELQYDENGKVKTNSVAINGDAIVNELGIDVNKGDFENIKVTNNKDFNTVKNALLPYLEKFGLNESNIRNTNGTVKIDLPVLKQSKKSTATEAKPTTEVISPEVVTEEVTPIRQLSNGSNIYFETEKYRVNDLQNGKVVLNVGNENDVTPIANIEFDSIKEAVEVAKKLNELRPNGLNENYDINGVIENLKNEVRSESLKEVTPTEEVIPTPAKPTTPKEVKSKYDVTYDDNGNITKITTKKGVEVKQFIEYEVFDKKTGKKVIKLKRNPGYTQIEAKILGVITNNKAKVEQEKAFRDALDKFTPTTEYEVALEALAKGVKVSNPKGEVGDRAGWATDKKADSIEVLAGNLAEVYSELDEKAIRDELIEIIRSNNSLAEVRDKLVSSTDENSAKLKRQEADAFLSGLNEKEFAMYEAMKAEDDYISELSDEEAINYYQELYKQQDEGQIDESTSAKSIGTKEVSTKQEEAFRDKIKDIPESGKVSKYLSGETIEKVEGETPRNAQEIDVMPLVEAGTHGKETVEMAKEIYGDKYIEKTLEFLDSANLKAHEKALLYVSLENEMFDLVNSEPNNVGLKKLQDLVRAKSQQFLRESSLAINMGRLRAIMKDGFNYEMITNKFLSTDQLIAKKEIEKAIQSDADAIQKEYEEQIVYTQEQLDIEIQKVREELAAVPKENVGSKARKLAKDIRSGKKAILPSWAVAEGAKGAKGQGLTFEKTFAKALETFADVHDATKDFAKAIDEGLKVLKQWYTKNNVDFNEDDIKGKFSEYVKPTKKELTNKQIVNQALIDAGFGREITVKGVKRNVLDWKKLAGEEGSVDKLRENVEKIIGKEAANELEDEYNNLRASIIEKSLNELERRNIPRKKVNLKTSAKKLAEIYNQGAFEKESDTYDHLMNTVLGMNQLDQESFNEAKKLSKSLAELFSQKDSNGNQLSQDYLKHGERVINKQIERLLSKVAWSESNGVYKATVIAKEFVGLAQRNALVSVGQAVENTTSGYISRAFKKIAFMFDNVDTKELRKSRNILEKMTFKDITFEGGLEFGDVTSPFITKSKTMDLIVNASDSRLYHALASTALGKPFLESADSMHKAALAQGFFHYNLIKILRKKGYSKSEAKNYVSEQLTGQSFEDALATSRQIIDKINESAGKKVIPDSKESIYRFANDLVNEALVQGNKITLDELEASLKSAETVAGFELGHEPNNIISKPLNLFNSWVQTRTDKAVKDKKWNDAAALTAASIVTTNILNPYVGGGTNWTLLAAQKAGIPTLSTIYWNIKSRGSKLDLSTEEGIKNLEKDLKYQLLAKNANARMFIGAAVTLAAFALAKSTGADDDLYEWLKKNPWANKYMKKVNPPAIQYMLAQKDKKLGEFLGQQMNIKADAFDEGKKLQRALKNAASGKTQQALGGVGQLAGSRLSTPIIPWRVVKDVRDIYRGLNGLPEIKHEFKASGFASGYFQGGMVEQLGLRPEDVKDETSGRQSSGSRSESGSRESSGNRTQSGSRE